MDLLEWVVYEGVSQWLGGLRGSESVAEWVTRE